MRPACDVGHEPVSFRRILHWSTFPLRMNLPTISREFKCLSSDRALSSSCGHYTAIPLLCQRFMAYFRTAKGEIIVTWKQLAANKNFIGGVLESFEEDGCYRMVIQSMEHAHSWMMEIRVDRVIKQADRQWLPHKDHHVFEFLV